ncbi:ABC transporter ATP-binding protein [Marinobacteraceae bacterium S3BR75-40.1]
MASLQLDQLAYGRHRKALNDPLTLQVGAGEVWAVLGENGVGKSTLMATLAGLIPPVSGQVHVDGVEVGRFPRKLLARRIGLLMQQDALVFPFRVSEAVAAGRYAHRGPWRGMSRRDEEVVAHALALVGLEGHGYVRVDRLSGGEQRRVAIATLLAQDPEILLLDEPTNHLDVRHQVRILAEVIRRARAGGIAILSLHDVNMAVRYADRVLLLYPDGQWEAGPPSEVVDRERLERLYGVPLQPIRDGDGAFWVPGQD